MANNELKLLGGWFSPFSLRVRIALNIKSLEYENHEETLNPKSHLLLQSNPVHKKIPVLLHGDKAICESRIIVEYIDEVWTSGPSILPSDAHDRAVARFWAAYIDDKVFNFFSFCVSVFLCIPLVISPTEYSCILNGVVVFVHDKHSKC